MAGRLRRGLDSGGPKPRRVPWFGINKQLDLQSAFTEVMRVVARDQGWYEARRQYQYAFIGAVAVLAAVVGAALIAAAGRLARRPRVEGPARWPEAIAARVSGHLRGRRGPSGMFSLSMAGNRRSVDGRREGRRGPEGGPGTGEGLRDRQKAPVQIERDEKGWPRAFWELAGSAPDFDLGDRTAAHERGDVLAPLPTADPSGPGRREPLRMTRRSG